VTHSAFLVQTSLFFCHRKIVNQGGFGRKNEGGHELHGIQKVTVLGNLEMQVAAGLFDAGAAHEPYDVASFHGLPGGYQERIEVKISGSDPLGVVDPDKKTAGAKTGSVGSRSTSRKPTGGLFAGHVSARELDHPIGDGTNRFPGSGVNVEAPVFPGAACAISPRPAGAQAGRAFEGRDEVEPEP
jgi:hypothetical protein